MADLRRSIERALKGPLDHLFVIVHNPVAGHILDESPALERWFAGHLAPDVSERGYGHCAEGASVIWQSRKGALPTRHSQRSRAIVAANKWQAALADG
ncbi:hypothetical protein D3C83_81850 [compost metagenome]